MSLKPCKHCAKKCPTIHSDEGFTCCTGCGKVIDSDMYTSEPSFIKSAGGQSQLSGRFIKSVESDISESRKRTLEKGREEISVLLGNLYISGGDNTIREALAFYKIAVERNFTRGRPTRLVAAACLYIVCREKNKPYLLIDFSEKLTENVYVLGAVFLQLCQLLRLEQHPIVQNLVDPTFFIHRFTENLFHGKNSDVSTTAMRILASMKRDWMQTGRKPSGLCGAALYISAHAHGLKCSKSDIESVVHVCEATLTKRLIEFENTESGSLTIEEFEVKAKELEAKGKQLNTELVARLPSNVGIKSSVPMELLCKHKKLDKPPPPFAHKLCKSCYVDFVELSGGLQGGLDPPAFQRAERERIAKSSSVEKDNEADLSLKEAESSAQPNQKVIVNGKLDSQLSEGVRRSMAVEEGSHGQSNENGNMDNVAGGEAESLSDIDDVEVDGYLHDEDEKRLKTIIWESLNREYIEEQAAKEKAAKAAYEAKFPNGSEDAEAAAAIAKSRKEKRQQRALEAKNMGPPPNAKEAARQMLTKKKLSSKINYDVFDKLFDDSTDADDSKKRKCADDDTTPNKRNREPEPDFVDDNKKMEDEYGEYDATAGMYGDETDTAAGMYGDETDTATGMYGDELYAGNGEAEEYDYDDYGY